jgi:riboflavin synthase
LFTGLVQGLGEVRATAVEGPGVRLTIAESAIAARCGVGDSIAINGCCLTAVTIAGDEMSFQAGDETLRRTNLGRLKPGDRVNLESSLRVGDPLGGHLVTGHIDALGTLIRRYDNADWCKMWIRTAPQLLRQMAFKGSVAVDGVSLTLAGVDPDTFYVALIPHTLAVTTLGIRQEGDTVNVETDVLAKYVERQLAARP